MDQREKAEAFRRLHDRKKALVLPNAWDVPSARVFEDEGFPAVATSSAGMLVSLGYPDGEGIPHEEFVAAVGRIARALSVPLSVDVIGGFGDTPENVAKSVRAVVAAGAVGINIEDFTHISNELLSLENQLVRLKALIRLREQTGVPFVINARTDALRFAVGDESARLQEAVRRSEAYRDLGVDCVYPIGLVDAASISAFVKALDFPTNVMVRRGLPPVPELERLGVARISFGPSASYAALGLLKRVSKEVREKGTYVGLTDGAISFDELNALAVPKKRA
ncbi:MAG: isocitrate lyase/phosphoenolpyruvate mutase family protein [Nitrososphaerota archaeon]|jgi:2-methylisocitrate lyase-like PEP mutase family enzyme|nr:isocitrate lyase/phosphoenolpyruvate mutase family protein [Nitrososphaerota archaeon]MDG6943039.1 isocitrate lyase/phosphoenolpyruvate mutase family protein [Nitrososphaerota archaeon]MDG6950768.1 isocitrate lyase/phosphoenolpyruvate mutase family protein [Nitrososphaerota archaeon]